MIRYGIVGTGVHMRETLLPALRLLPGAQVSACCSRSYQNAANLAATWGVPLALEDWHMLVDSPEVDAVVVSGPPDLHEKVARYCLEKSVPVFVEKPPTLTLAGLEKLAAAEQSGVPSFVGFNFPYGASYQRFMQTLQSNGKLRQGRIRFVSSKPLEAEWGCTSLLHTLLLAQGVHPINMATRIWGEPKRVHPKLVPLAEGRVSLTLDIEFSEGAHATIELGNYMRSFEYRCEYLTDSGVYGILDQHNTLSFSGLADSGAGFDGKELITFRWPSRRGGYARTGYQTELQEFQDCVAKRQATSSPFADAIPAYQVIEMALSALEGGRSS